MGYFGRILNILIVLAGAQAFANTGSPCDFLPRGQMPNTLSALPHAVVGFATCKSQNPDLNSFMVGRFKKLDEKTLKTFLRESTIAADGTATSAVITWESSQPLSARQFLVKTESPPNPSRPRVDLMSHYAFVARAGNDDYLVYIHTTSPRAAERLKSEFPGLNRNLSGARFTASVH